MRCFYHDSTEAVAICKSCNRGICRDCTVEFKNGVACKNRCEGEVEALNQIIERSKTSYQKTSSAYSRNAIVYLMFAVVFGFLGVTELRERPVLGWAMLALALVFLISTFFNYSNSRRFMKSETDKRT
jgi:hypothetical protein